MLSAPERIRVQPRRGPPSLVPDVLPLRGCQLCDHGRGPDHLRTCGHPRGAMAPVDQVRSRGGACGPEALLLSFPGL